MIMASEPVVGAPSSAVAEDAAMAGGLRCVSLWKVAGQQLLFLAALEEVGLRSQGVSRKKFHGLDQLCVWCQVVVV